MDVLLAQTDRLGGIRARHGKDAIGLYVGNPTVHNLGLMLLAPVFLRTLHTRNRFSATSVDQLPHMFAAYHMWGHQLLLPVPDLDRSDYFLALGANPLSGEGISPALWQGILYDPGARAEAAALAAAHRAGRGARAAGRRWRP